MKPHVSPDGESLCLYAEGDITSIVLTSRMLCPLRQIPIFFTRECGKYDIFVFPSHLLCCSCWYLSGL